MPSELQGRTIAFLDGNIITSRSPDDLNAFCQAITDQFASTPAHT